MAVWGTDYPYLRSVESPGEETAAHYTDSVYFTAGEFQQKLGFYSCTVPSFEQYTLTRFLRDGHFEKHLNRMRKAYKSRRNAVAAALLESPFAHRMRLLEQDAGLHFLLQVDTDLTEAELIRRCADAGIRVRTLSSYYHGEVPPQDRNCLVINYSGLQRSQIALLAEKLQNL